MPKPKLPLKTFSWSPNLAYIIGLLVTDGNLSNDGRHIIMRSSDRDLLETFNSCLDLKNKISETKNNGFAKRPSYRVQFGNIQFYKWLVKIGLAHKKTYNVGEIKIPDKYFRDFLRGHLDGDGTILTYDDRYNKYRGRTYVNLRVFLYFISASRTHIDWLIRKIRDLTKVKGSLTCSKPVKSNRVPMWRIKFSKKEAVKILRWMYYQENLPCLERKRELVRKIFNLVVNEKRRKYSRITS
ncbi:hypothetical protein HYV21_02180 [Candidatus Microgenomates bacterium]|nr:hypothetical protein [Candidatus Microgenomates bacterium]